MLVITRKLGEKIMIGDDIVVTLLETKGSQARIGVEAPRNISIHRREIFDRIKQENLESSKVCDEDIAKAADLWRKSGAE